MTPRGRASAEPDRRCGAQRQEGHEFVPQVVKRARKEAEREEQPRPGPRVFEPVEFGRIHEDDEELLVELVGHPGWLSGVRAEVSVGSCGGMAVNSPSRHSQCKRRLPGMKW